MRRLTLPCTLLLGLAAACGADPKDGEDTTTTTPTEYEGDAAGECADGADNDRDALFDCDDDDCAGSPDCDGDACEAASARTSAKIHECLPDQPPSDDTDLPEPPPDCTPTLQALVECLADCADAADCSAFDGTDLDATTTYGDCVSACADVAGGGDTDPTAGDTAGIPIGGFSTDAYFGYDPINDTARAYTTADGTAVDISFGFMFFNEDYLNTRDVDDTCYFLLNFAGPLPRASWAGAGSSYLFGFEVDPEDATMESDCDDLFGTGATDELYEQIIHTGVWGVGVAETIGAVETDRLVQFGRDPAEYLGGDFYTTSDMTPAETWSLHAAIYEVDASYRIRSAAGQPLRVDAADAIQDRSNNRIPTAQTPIGAVYSVSTYTLFVYN